MSSSSSSSRLQIVPTHADDDKCGWGLPRYEHTSWSYGNPGKRIWNYPNSLTRRRNYNYFKWKDAELLDDHYKGLLRRMKAQMDVKEDGSEVIQSRKSIHELEVQLAKDNVMYEQEVMKLRGDNAGLRGWVKQGKWVVVGLIGVVVGYVLKMSVW